MAKANQVTLSSGSFGIDARDFSKFARALRKAEPELAAQLTVRLRGAGGIVAQDAQAKAEEASHTIPPSIKVRVSGLTVSVVAGGSGIPLAGLMEIGNVGAGAGAATFRHPLWGHWVKGKGIQATHPYLFPALQEDADAVGGEVAGALDWVVGELAFE